MDGIDITLISVAVFAIAIIIIGLTKRKQAKK